MPKHTHANTKPKQDVCVCVCLCVCLCVYVGLCVCVCVCVCVVGRIFLSEPLFQPLPRASGLFFFFWFGIHKLARQLFF